MMAELESNTSSPSKFEANAVCVQNLTKSYGKGNPVLHNVSMSVKEGSVYGLLGSSGCGKSTLLCCILNLKVWDAGEVFIFGERVERGIKIKGENIGYMPQDTAMYDHLTVQEMMKYFSRLYGMKHKMFKERMAFVEDLIDLKGFRPRRIITLSGGQKRRVSMSLALLHNPKLLILDEPTVGLDPLLRERVWKYLFELTVTSKTSIVITTHYIEEVKRANKVGIMRKGRILVEDDPAVLMQQYNTFILEHVVRNICYSDTTQTSKENYSQHGRTTFSKLQRRKNSLDPVSLLQFYRTGNTNKPPVLNMERGTPAMGQLEKGDSFWNDSILAPMTRSLEYSRVCWINFTRNPIFVIMLLLLPPFVVIIVSLVTGTEPKDLPIGVVNHEISQWESMCPNNISGEGNTSLNSGACDDTSLFSCNYINQLRNTDLIKPIEFLTTEEAHHAVEQGDITGYIQIPNNFSQHLIERAMFYRFSSNETVDGTLLKMKMDMSDSITMFFFMKYMYTLYSNFVHELETKCNFTLKGLELPFLYRSPVFGEVDGSVEDDILPPGIVVLVFQVAFAVTPLVLIYDTKSGVLERTKTAGLGIMEYMMGLLMTMVSVAFLQSFLIYITVVYIIRFRFHGNILNYIGLCLLSGIQGTSLGFLAGALFRNEMTIIICAVFIFPILVDHDGFLRPMDFLPKHYRSLVHYCFPTAALVQSYQSAMSRELGLIHSRVWPGLLITLGYTAVFAILAFIIFKRSQS